MCAESLAEYEFDLLKELQNWFTDHLDSPFDHLPHSVAFETAVCWFKSTAREHLARAWEVATILERNDVWIWTIKSTRVGYIHYEDEVQVFASPYTDIRPLLGGKRN